MRKSFLFVAAAFVFLTSVALAQYNPYDSGYYNFPKPREKALVIHTAAS